MPFIISYAISPTTAAATWVSPEHWNAPYKIGCLSVIGELGASEEIAVEIPVSTTADESTDADWTPLMIDGSAVVLTATHNIEPIPVGLLFRVKKPVTANSVGLRWT